MEGGKQLISLDALSMLDSILDVSWWFLWAGGVQFGLGLKIFGLHPAALFRPELSVFTRILSLLPIFHAFLSSEFRPGFVLNDCSNWPALIWSGLEEFRPRTKMLQLPEFPDCRWLLLEFSLSILVRFMRFHLWINPWSLVNNFHVLILARFGLELGQNRELQSAVISAKNRAARRGRRLQVSWIAFCPPHFWDFCNQVPVHSAKCGKVQIGPSMLFQAEKCSLVLLL